MSKAAKPTKKAITNQFIQIVCERLADNKRIRRTLPVWGRLHIDRQLPFLCLYRRPPKRPDEGTSRLVTSEASYLTASAESKLQPGLTALVRAIARESLEIFGGFLILELWSGEAQGDNESPGAHDHQPQFRIVVPKISSPDTWIYTFESSLRQIKVSKQAALVEVERTGRIAPRGFKSLLPTSEAYRLGCTVIGLEVCPIYRDPDNGELYPLLLRELRRGLTLALRRAFFEFARTRTTKRPRHYHVLGRRAVTKAVWEVDRRISRVSDGFDPILQVTPVNAAQEWNAFERRRFQREPVFQYRPLLVDPSVLKRRLHNTSAQRVEDPALAHLFQEKIEELDRQITMVQDINTKRFVYSSLQIYGSVSDEHMRLAEHLLKRLPPRARDDSKVNFLDAKAFARLAEAEVAYYREQWPDISAEVFVRDDVASGLMVSQGALLIGSQTRIPVARAEALLQHEVGTHLLTYYNGRAQPFRQLYAGLAGYEALQEGLAVLAEYLVGGLSRPRLRVLAARVLAARLMLDGASFVETFRKLCQTYGFERRTAFIVTMRIYRGGGLTKDILYLLGFQQLLDYLGKGESLKPLFVGKIAATHIPIVQELKWRQVLREPPLTPRYLKHPEAKSRLEGLQKGMTVVDIVERRYP